MKVISLIVSRPICSFIFLTFAVLFVPVLVIPCWYHTIKRVEHDVHLNSVNFQLELSSQVENTAKLLHPLNSSATNLARILISSLNGTQISPSNIETKVAPNMFLSLSTIPYLSQISYIGSDGLFFSYCTHNNQTFSISSNSSNPNYWYTQPVNQNTGNPYGDAVKSLPAISINSSFFQGALKSKNGYASVEIGLKNSQDLVFLNTVSLNGSGALSLGFPVKFLNDFFGGIDFNGGGFFLATEEGKVLVEGIPNANMEFSGNSVFFQTGLENGEVGNVSCGLNNGGLRSSVLSIRGTKYEVYCSRVDIVGVQSVYALAFPHKGTLSNLQKNGKVTLMLLILMMVIMVISILSFVILIFRAVIKENDLYDSLIKQHEATKQAERKSMNKSDAFATASHDIRSSLAGIAGLIGLCYDEAAPGSELETNLKQMDACEKDLLGLLNSILDASKIEAGKMQLEEADFNLAQLLEDVVDLYHPAAMKKGVDVVLDPHDNIIKFSQVKGDRGKLKQILCNLLSNAEKFTSEGHILVRAWVREKQNLENFIINSNRNGLVGCLSCLFDKKRERLRDIEANVKENVSCMEYVFEVDDTGKGIPKERQESVFENYVQVKETGLGQGGTGLGLGIVQSLVRLMGGEIEIVDKQMGERGTCFRFNVCLAISDTTISVEHHHPKQYTESAADIQNLRLTIRTPSPGAGSGLSLRSPSPRLPISPKPQEGSHVVLLIQSEVRRRNSRKFLESHGIKVSVVEQWENLPQILKKIKHKLNISGKSSDLSKSSSFSSMDLGSEQILPIYRKINLRGSAPSFILLVIDASAGPFSELCRIVGEFRKCTPGVCCKVVWLDPTARSINFNLDPDDDIIRKPFHGSRLDRVLRFLPEFGGNLQREQGSSSSENQTRKMLSHRLNQTDVNFKSRKQIGVSGIQEHDSGKPLTGKKILVAEDTEFLRKVAMENLKKLGASVELCENGEKALEMVCKGLSDQRKHTSSTRLPYDYVFMDCEMPIMDGYEATRRIRKVEKYYGVHIPIIALTAHTSGEEAKKTILAGMDVHLGKPLKIEQLLEAIQSINNIQ